jgi:hypothetical protein
MKKLLKLTVMLNRERKIVHFGDCLVSINHPKIMRR